MNRWLTYTLSALALGCMTLVATPVNAAGRDEARASRGDRGARGRRNNGARSQNRARTQNRTQRARTTRRAERSRTQRARTNRRIEQARTRRARDNRRAAQARSRRAREANQARRARQARRNRRVRAQNRRIRHNRRMRRAHRANHRRYRPVRWVSGRRGAYWVNSGRRHRVLPRRARRVHRHGGWYFHWDGLYFALHDGVYVQVDFNDDPCCDEYGCGLCDDAPGEVEVWY